MLVVAIVGLLAGIAIPKFANMIIKAKEAAVKGKLGAFRSAISIYYADTEGAYPNMTGPYNGAPMAAHPTICPQDTCARWLGSNETAFISIPTASHAVGSGVNNSLAASPIFSNTDWMAGMAWNYNRFTGQLIVSCTHRDTAGRQWTSH